MPKGYVNESRIELKKQAERESRRATPRPVRDTYLRPAGVGMMFWFLRRGRR
jgi:hypothetical protein